MVCPRSSGAVPILSLSFSLTVALAQGLLLNRSFETGKDPGEAMVLPPGSKAIEEWTVIEGNVSYVGGKWKASEGTRSIGLLCGGGISQTFKTDPKEKYEVRFSMAGDPTAPPAVKSVAVSFGAERRVFTFDTTGRSPGEMGWDSRSWLFTAAAESTTVAFHSPKGECSTPAVDNVRVMPGDGAVQAQPIDGPAGRDAILAGNLH